MTLADDPHESPEPQETPELTPEQLLKLSNVVRLRIYLALRAFGPLRARRLAELTGVTETSMNRHLDVMREIGFVTVEQAGKTRQSWVWSPVPGGVHVGRLEGGEMQEAAIEWLRAISGGYGILISQWPTVAASWPQAWQSAAETTNWVLHLTAEQLDRMAAEVRDVAQRWQHISEGNQAAWREQRTTPADSDWIAPVLFIINAFPYPHRPE